jgi:type I restriction enzyme M protein
LHRAELRANSKLKSSEYSVPVLGLVFLRYADHKFQAAAKELTGGGSGRRKIGPVRVGVASGVGPS